LGKTLALSLEKLVEEPYASIMSYPEHNKKEVSKRLRELQRLGVTALRFSGRKQVLNVPVLGKGCVGVVTIAYRKSEKVALKIRRIDADRATMQHEARMLERANLVQVGPRLLGVSKNFLLMQFVDGILLPDWLETRIAGTNVRKVLREILEQCWRLDKAGLDHGELSHAPKHLIIDQESSPVIVDFETASTDRRVSNVTSVCQFLFVGSEIAGRVAVSLDKISKEAIIEVLRHYKAVRSREAFDGVLDACGL
jgi:putative serine/threonine protein kinase